MNTRALVSMLVMLLLLPALAAGQDSKTASYFAKLNTSGLQPGQTAVVAVVVDVKDGFHAQSHTPLDSYLIPFSVTGQANDSIEFLDPVYPTPGTITSPALGTQSVYTGRTIVYLPLRVKPGAAVGELNLTVLLTFQACDANACFRPVKDAPIAIATKIVGAEEQITPTNAELFRGFDSRVFAVGAALVMAPVAPPSATSVDFFGRHFELGSKQFGFALGVALVVGLLFNLMPCVLPVLPLKAIGFLEVSQQNRLKCFLLGVVFSLGVVAIFVLLAILIVAFKSTLHFSWGEQFKYGWFVWSMVIILTVMALGMFGLFEVVLPTGVYNLTPSHDTYFGNYLFGMLTAVLSTPCTAPMFAGLLAWAVAQPTSHGVAVVIMVGMGMALPYLLLSAFPGLASRVPRTGPWSAVLKQMMGFLVLAVAVYFAGGRLSSTKIFFWAVFAVVAGAMLFLIVRTFQLAKTNWPKISSIIAAVAVIWLALSLTLRLTGGLEWQPYSQQAFAQARATGKPVMVEFTANWCSNCLALEASVFHDPKIARAVKSHEIILLRADLTATDAPGWNVVNQLNPGGGIPLTAIYGPKQDEPVKLTSLYTSQNLIDAIEKAAGGGA